MNDRATYVDWCGGSPPKDGTIPCRPQIQAVAEREEEQSQPQCGAAGGRSITRGKIGRRTANVPGITTVNSVVFRKSFTSCHPTRPEIQIAPSIPVRVTSRSAPAGRGVRHCNADPRRVARFDRKRPNQRRLEASAGPNTEDHEDQGRRHPSVPQRPSTPWIWRRPPWSASRLGRRCGRHDDDGRDADHRGRASRRAAPRRMRLQEPHTVPRPEFFRTLLGWWSVRTKRDGSRQPAFAAELAEVARQRRWLSTQVPD